MGNVFSCDGINRQMDYKYIGNVSNGNLSNKDITHTNIPSQYIRNVIITEKKISSILEYSKECNNTKSCFEEMCKNSKITHQVIYSSNPLTFIKIDYTDKYGNKWKYISQSVYEIPHYSKPQNPRYPESNPDFIRIEYIKIGDVGNNVNGNVDNNVSPQTPNYKEEMEQYKIILYNICNGTYIFLDENQRYFPIMASVYSSFRVFILSNKEYKTVDIKMTNYFMINEIRDHYLDYIYESYDYTCRDGELKFNGSHWLFTDIYNLLFKNEKNNKEKNTG